MPLLYAPRRLEVGIALPSAYPETLNRFFRNERDEQLHWNSFHLFLDAHA